MSLIRTRVDLDAIAHNTRLIKSRVGDDVRLMAVVKADGYNHGAAEVAHVMADNGAGAFGVATPVEAVELREAGIDKPILAWLWNPDDEVTDALAAGVELGVPSPRHLRALVDAEIPAKICLKVETGMHRSGIDEDSWRECFKLARDAKHLTVTGLFSHLACADEPANPATDAQGEAFARAIALGRELGIELPVNHLCNSPGTLTRPDLHHEQVRVGLALYGMNPLDPSGDDYDLRPAMTWAADVVAVKAVQPGDAVSYGHTHVVDRPGFTAVIGAGYADGVPRVLSSKLEVTIDGHTYRQIGRVCMDQLVVDLGDTPHGVGSGSEAILFGPGGRSVDEFAADLGTINYEVACLPKGRTGRTYVGDGR